MDAAGKGLATKPPPGVASGVDITVREVSAPGDFDACVALQREVWGKGFSDVVPASLLKIGSEVGGVTAGAFTRSGTLVGFVYGLTGVREGHLTHWSHMLGVLRSHRGMGIGYHLKNFQKERLLSRGIEEMRWTFDPLVAGNAHFNLTLLGARVDRYVPDMYGDMGSDLHAFGTDRFVAHWDLRASADASNAGIPPTSAWDLSPILDPGSEIPESAAGDPWTTVRIEIPGNVSALGRENPSSAREWRLRTRQAFMTAFQSGYEVVGFAREGGNGTGHYLLRRRTG